MALGGENEIDQILFVENGAGSGVAPVLELTPLDSAGEAIPDLVVRTAFGSDRGRVVVPPRTAVLDVLRFEGPRARDVEDVRARVARIEEVTAPAPTEEVVAQRFDRRGRSVEMGDFFDSFRVTNPNKAGVAVRVALLEYEDPPPGEAQQAIRVTQVSPLLRLAPGAQKRLRLPARLRGRVVGSLKAYFSR